MSDPSTSSNMSNNQDIFTNPSSDVWVDYPVRAPAPTEPPLTLPKKNIGYFAPTVPSSVPGWRTYNPFQGTSNVIPSGFDPIGWNCANCFFRLENNGKNLCTKHRFEIPLGSWRCNNWVVRSAKFTPFVKEQVPFANEDVLPLVDQQGRFLVDIYKFINVDPQSRYAFISGYHSHSSPQYYPVFILGPYRNNVLGNLYNYLPAVRSDWLPFSKSGQTYYGACIPMSTVEREGWIQYDIDPVSNAFVNMRYFPKTGQSLEFISIGAPQGFVAMMSKSIVNAWSTGGFSNLPSSYFWWLDFNFWSQLFFGAPANLLFSSGDDLVSSKPVLEAYGDKSVPVTINPLMFDIDKVEPAPVIRQEVALTPVSTGLLGIPREETALNLFEDINKIGLDTSRWVAKTIYQYSSVEPIGWYDSYSVRNNPDEQLPEGVLPYETALRVESDIQNSGINLLCRVPPSTFPWHRYSSYGQAAYDEAVAKWDSTNISFPAYGSPRINGVSSMAELTSRQYFAYQPGRITGFTFGVRACPPEFVGSTSEVTWGIENDENAMFFRLNAGAWSLVRARFNTFNPFTRKWASYRSEVVNQGSFNGDNLNGFGGSQYVMQWNTVTMFKIEYGWYGGVGARLYVYVPVGNNAAKWVRIHDFGPPQSDAEPNTPADLKNKRYPTLSTPWFKVFYRILSSNGAVNDQGLLSLSKYGVSVYIDGGNPNSPQVTNVFGGTKIIPAYNVLPPTSGENIFRSDVYPIVSTKYKVNMKKRVTVDSIPGAKTETTNYKIIVPKTLSVTAQSTATTGDKITPIRVDMWTASGLKDTEATVGKVISYPSGYNYTLNNMVPDANNSKNFHLKKDNYWWEYIPPVYLAPDWSRAAAAGDLSQETNQSPTRPDLFPPGARRYLYGDFGGRGTFLRSGRVYGVSVENDPRFFAMRVANVGAVAQDPFAALRSPTFYTFNESPELSELAKVGFDLSFSHPDMVMISDPIFESYFNFSFEYSGDVYGGFYYHRPSVNNPAQTANQIAKLTGWREMVEAEIAAGMWPLYFTPWSLHGSYGLFSENSNEAGGRAFVDTQDFKNTKYILDNFPSALKYNAAQTRIVGGTARGTESRDFVQNKEGYGVHFVFLLAPGSSIRNVTVIANPGTNDQEKRSVRFLGQPDSLYASSSSNAFFKKVYGKSLIGQGVQFPAVGSQTALQWLQSLPALSSSPSFAWGRPGVEVNVQGSSDRLPANFKDQDENSGILIDTDATQKLDKSRFELLGSFFIYAPKPQPSSVEIQPFNFDLSTFFSYNGTAIRGPGDYTFFVTAQNLTSVEDGGSDATVVASLQCEEG